MDLQHWCHWVAVHSWAAGCWSAASGHCDRWRAPMVSWPGNLLDCSFPSQYPPILDHKQCHAVASGLQIGQHMTLTVVVVLSAYITLLIWSGSRICSLKNWNRNVHCVQSFSLHIICCKKVWSPAWTHKCFFVWYPDIGSHQLTT